MKRFWGCWILQRRLDTFLKNHQKNQGLAKNFANPIQSGWGDWKPSKSELITYCFDLIIFLKVGS